MLLLASQHEHNGSLRQSTDKPCSSLRDTPTAQNEL